jgi:hypothetical protein
LASKKFSRLSVLLEAKDKMSGPFQKAAQNASKLSNNMNKLGNDLNKNSAKVNKFGNSFTTMTKPIKLAGTAVTKLGTQITKAIGGTATVQMMKGTKAWWAYQKAVEGTKQKVREAALATNLFVRNSAGIEKVANKFSKIQSSVNKFKSGLQSLWGTAGKTETKLGTMGSRGRATFNQLVVSNQKLNSQLSKMNSQLDRANSKLASMKSNMGSLNSMGAAFTALYTAQALGQAATAGTTATVGKAMEQQYSSASISILTGDEKKGAEYYKQIQDYAASTAYSAEDWARNMRGAISKSGNVQDLEKYQVVMEQLATLDPAQGLDGAALAIRELNSGDAVSLVERFELPRSALNSIKNIEDPIEQISKLSEIIGKETGYTAEAVQKMKELPLMQWEKLKNTVSTIFGYMGAGALDVIAPYLEQFNKAYDAGKFNGFIKSVSAGLASFAEMVANVGKAIYGAFESGAIQEKLAPFITMFNNIKDTLIEAWPTISAIFSDMWTVLSEVATVINNNWPTINSLFQTMLGLVKSVSGWIAENWGTILPIILGVVGAFKAFSFIKTVVGWFNSLKNVVMAAGGVFKFAKTALSILFTVMRANPIGLVVSLIIGLVTWFITAYQTSDTFREKVDAVWAWLKEVGVAAVDAVTDAFSSFVDGLKAAWDWIGSVHEKFTAFADAAANTTINWGGIAPGGEKFINWGGGKNKKHGGLNNVPYNGYQATLHKGERVLTAMENKAYNNGQGVGSGVTITGNQFIVRQDSDIDAIAEALYSKLSSTRVQMG